MVSNKIFHRIIFCMCLCMDNNAKSILCCFLPPFKVSWDNWRHYFVWGIKYGHSVAFCLWNFRKNCFIKSQWRWYCSTSSGVKSKNKLKDCIDLNGTRWLIKFSIIAKIYHRLLAKSWQASPLKITALSHKFLPTSTQTRWRIPVTYAEGFVNNITTKKTFKLKFCCFLLKVAYLYLCNLKIKLFSCIWMKQMLMFNVR